MGLSIASVGRSGNCVRFEGMEIRDESGGISIRFYYVNVGARRRLNRSPGRILTAVIGSYISDCEPKRMALKSGSEVPIWALERLLAGSKRERTNS